MSPPADLQSRNDFIAEDEAQEEEEAENERLQAQRHIQMLDLGTGRRDWVTTVDRPLPTELKLSKEQLLQARKVNEKGTKAATLFQQNKQALNAWNTIGDSLAEDHADREKLDDLMDGQSHRARLNRDIKEQGGQDYGASSTIEIDKYPRSKRRMRSETNGIPARCGRESPMQLSVRGAANQPTKHAMPSLISAGHKGDRPLDPAVDPDRGYGYKVKRGGKAITVPYRGGKPNEVRAPTRDSTGRLGLSNAPRVGSRRPRHPRTPPLAPVTVQLNDQAFLRVMNNMQISPPFSENVQEKSKPANNTKTVPPTESVASETKARGSPSMKSLKTPVQALRRLEIGLAQRQQVRAAGGNLGSMSANGPPLALLATESREKRGQGSSVSVHTEGVESADTFHSAEFASHNSDDPPSEADQTSGKANADLDLQQEKSTTGPEKQAGLKGLANCELEKEDLIWLNQDSELSRSFANGVGEAYASPKRSSGIPDIMNEDLNIDLPQTSLIPSSSSNPQFIMYHGSRYIRADLVRGPDLEELLKATRPQGHGNADRVSTTKEQDVGLQTLQEIAATSILGDHNLPGRSQGSTETSPAPGSEGPTQVSEGLSHATGRTEHDRSQIPQRRVDRTVPPRVQQDNPSLLCKEQTEKWERAATNGTSSEQQGTLTPPNLFASKFATPGFTVTTGSGASTGSNAGPSGAETSVMGGRHMLSEDKTNFSSNRSGTPSKTVATAKFPDDVEKVQFNFSFTPLSVQNGGSRQESPSDRAAKLSGQNLPRKQATLRDSIWGRSAAVAGKQFADTRIRLPSEAGKFSNPPSPTVEEAASRINPFGTQTLEQAQVKMQDILQENIATSRVEASETTQLSTRTGMKFTIPSVAKPNSDLMASKFASKASRLHDGHHPTLRKPPFSVLDSGSSSDDSEL